MDSIPIYRYKSGLEPDSGLFSWDWAGAWLEIRDELGQQVQRSASATPWRASSICSPQPDQVAFLQISQVTFEHIGWLLFYSETSGVGPVGIEPTTHGLKVRCSTD